MLRTNGSPACVYERTGWDIINTEFNLESNSIIQEEIIQDTIVDDPLYIQTFDVRVANNELQADKLSDIENISISNPQHLIGTSVSAEITLQNIEIQNFLDKRYGKIDVINQQS